MGVQKYQPKWKDPKLLARMFELLSEGTHTYQEISEILKQEGHIVSINTIGDYARDERKYGALVTDSEGASLQILDSIEKVSREFDEIYDRTKTLLDKWEANPEKYSVELLGALRLLHDMLNTALRKLGFMKSMVVQKNVTITQNYNEMNMFIADLGAKIENGKVIIDNPRPELLEVLTKCERKKKSSDQAA